MNNSKTILTVVLLMAGTLLTTTAVAIVPAAYAGGDDHDDDNGDGNKNKAEDESNASLADCDDNDVERAGFDCFAIAGDEEENVIPPVEVGCPEETVWDITIRGEAEQGGVPIGTVICLFQGLGNHPAVVIPPGEEEFETNVNTDQPNVANCNAPAQQRAQVTSGIPPNPLEMGSSLCATVDLA